MAHYIDKDALVAEIKRRMDENRGKQSLPQYFGMMEEDLNILSFIDTLEVKKPASEEQIEYLAKAMDEADKRKEALQNERELNPDAFTKEVSADNKALLDAAREYKERTPFQYPNQLQPAYEAFIAGAQWHKQYWDKVMRDNHVEII